MGVHKNFLSAYLRTSGDFIAPSDQDDIWNESKIEKLISIIDDKILAYSQSEVKFTNSESIGSFKIRNPFVTILELIWDNRLLGHACLFRKNVLEYIKYALDFMNSNFGKIQSNAHDHIAPLVAFSLNSYVITDDFLQIWRRHPNVCNLQFVSGQSSEKKHISGYKKFLSTSYMLFKGKKSQSIMDTFSARSHLLYYILEKNKKLLDPKFRLYCKLTHYISQQTLLSYIMAGMVCIRIRKTSKNSNFKRKLREISFAFRYPFTYWFDMHEIIYL
jgi:hypothetical protein